MFFSVQHLIGQDAKFALVWRAATSGSTKKLSRKAVIGMSVCSMCREILKFAPSGKLTEAELTSKFSLYLLGQLIYGTVLIFDRQVTLFEVDARSAYEACRRLPMEELLSQHLTKSDSTGKKRRRSKITIELNTGDIDINEPPESRFVGLARRSEITMLETEPLIWRRPDLFHDEELQMPIDFSKERFIDWNDQRSSQSSKESVQTASEHRKEPTSDPTLLNEELPPFPPPEAFQNMDRESFMAGNQHVVEVGDITQGGPVQVEQSAMDAQPLRDAEPSTKKPRLAEIDQSQLRDVSASREVAATGDATMKPSLELSPIDGGAHQRLLPLRRRRVPQPLDMQGLFISYESIKKMQTDYSSLLKTKDELRAGMALDKHPTLRELLLPFPAYAGNRFPKECIELYHSRFSDNMTFEQALTENIFDPVNRGPASTLWRYSGSEQSSKESSEYELIPGIAYLNETPDRVRAAAARMSDSSSVVDEERNKRIEEDTSALLTPGRATITETPNRGEGMVAEVGQSDVLRRGYRSLPGDLSTPAVPGDTLPLAADVTLPEYERFRESRSSFLEQARRMTRGTDDMEGRPSSVQLYDPIQPGDFSQASILNASGRLLSLSPSIREKITSEESRLLIDAAREANRPIPLSVLIPYNMTSKKRAATVFSTLLYLVGKTVLEAKQYDSYGEIWVRACSATTSSDHDVDAMLSGGSMRS